MKFIKYLFVLFALNIILSSCGTFTDATDVLRNEKTKSTDEFLVKKRAPLTQPPNFEKMPQPNSIKGKKIVNNGHKALYFIGEDKDPELYINDLIL